jgi:N-acetylmuramoyl-L-alanine amidase
VRTLLRLSLVLGSALIAMMEVRAATTLFQGRPYQSIPGWSRSAGFQWAWIRPGEEFVMSNRWARFRFLVDSRRAEFNGIAVWLSEPAARRNSEPFIARIDFDTMIQPLLNPPRLPGKGRIDTIALDPGHGGHDPGNQEGRQQEKKYAFLLAGELRDILVSAGLKVILTRTTDVYVEKSKRPEIAVERGADMFVSLHFNAAPDRQAGRGSEVYCLTPPGASSTNAGGEGGNTGPLPGNRFNDWNLVFAYQVQRALVNGLALDDRGVRRARFAVLKPIQIPSILVESSFMTNPEDLSRIIDPGRRRQLAQAIADGVLASKRLFERGEPSKQQSR